MKSEPKNVEAWYCLGLAHSNLKRPSDAIEAYRQAILINPNYANAWGNLGHAYYFSGNQAAALDAVRELRRLDPEKADRLFNMIVPR